MIIDKLNCTDCPAHNLKDRQCILQRESLRDGIAKLLPKINLYLLCESLPRNRFFYDETSNYLNGGLRYNLRRELVGSGSDRDLFRYLSKQGIILVDCALCPLFKLENKTERRYAATLCLQNNTFPYLDLNPGAPIITIFPAHCGFLQRPLESIKERIIGNFRFSKLRGLKKLIAT